MNRAFYYAGMGAGIFYLLGDIVGGIITPNYHYIKQAVSELIQSGAPNRIILSSFLFIHSLMIILFSTTFLAHHPYKDSKLTNVGGILLLIVGICHALSSTAFPMDPVGTGMTFPGIMHLILVGMTVVTIFLLMPLIGIGLQRYYRWNSFKGFTFVCLAVIVIAGVSSPVMITKNIQIMGLTERITGYTFYIWLSVLTIRLLRELTKE